MKKLLIVLTLCCSSAFAQSVQQCVSDHNKLAKQYPDIPYEKDQEIISIWCKCEADQTKKGKNSQETLEYCAANTNSEINQYLKSKGKL